MIKDFHKSKKYRFLIPILIVCSITVILSIIYLDIIINSISDQFAKAKNKNNTIITEQSLPNKSVLKFKDTKLWKDILADYKILKLGNRHPQSLFRPGIIKDYELGKRITFLTVTNEEHNIKVDETTNFILPTKYVVNGIEQNSYVSQSMSLHTAFKYYIKKNSEIFVEANSPEAFTGGKYQGGYTVLFVEY